MDSFIESREDNFLKIGGKFEQGRKFNIKTEHYLEREEEDTLLSHRLYKKFNLLLEIASSTVFLK